jgi:hypothetical protein
VTFGVLRSEFPSEPLEPSPPAKTTPIQASASRTLRLLIDVLRQMQRTLSHQPGEEGAAEATPDAQDTEGRLRRRAGTQDL